MNGCPICQHAKKEAINMALLSGRHVQVIARQFRVNPEALTDHRAHMASQDKDLMVDDTLQHAPNEALADEADGCLCYWCGMSGYQRLLRAWAEANTQEKERFCVDTRTMDVPF